MDSFEQREPRRERIERPLEKKRLGGWRDTEGWHNEWEGGKKKGMSSMSEVTNWVETRSSSAILFPRS